MSERVNGPDPAAEPGDRAADRLVDRAADRGDRVALLEAALRREQKKVALVQEIGRALSSALELDQLLVLIMERITQLMEADRSTLYLLSDDGRELWSKVVQGGEVFEIRLAVGEGIAGWVAQSGDVVNISDAYNDDRFQPAVDLKSGYRTRSILCIPMRGSLGSIIGVLQCLNKQGGPFTDADEELLAALASQGAIAIENAKLYHSMVAKNVELSDAKARLEQKTVELNALYEVEKELSAATDLDALLERILAQATVVLGAAAGSIALREPDGQSLRFRVVVGPAAAQLLHRTLPTGSGVLGWAASRREAVIVNNPSYDGRHAADFVKDTAAPAPRHIMAAPLVDDDEVLGAIQILDKVRPHAVAAVDGDGFDETDLKLLVLIAGQIAKAIALARSRSEQSNQDRLASIGRMLASVLHDLKTPMTIISGYAQLMAQTEEPDQREAYVEHILRQFDIMAGMTREVLLFARGDADIVIRKVYLHRFLDEVMQQLRHALAGRNVTVEMDARYDGTALFDEQKMLRVIHNLARNAADAMPSGGKFRISTSLDGDAWLVFAMSDDGPGIPPELQGRLFELFSSGKKGGTGLGLAIVKKIVDDHHGQISYDSGPDGTTFRIRLPRQRVQESEAAA
jgi:signal transduction histidine kinase